MKDGWPGSADLKFSLKAIATRPGRITAADMIRKELDDPPWWAGLVVPADRG
jgi:hypothetical protein